MSKRGPYKRYLLDDSVPIPRTTRWRQNKNDNNYEDGSSSDESSQNNRSDAHPEEDESFSSDDTNNENAADNDQDKSTQSNTETVDTRNDEREEVDSIAENLSDENQSDVALMEDFIAKPVVTYENFLDDTTMDCDERSGSIHSDANMLDDISSNGENGTSQFDVHSVGSSLAPDDITPTGDNNGFQQLQKPYFNIQQLLDEPEWTEPLYDGCCMSILQVCLIIAAYATSVSLTNDGLQNLLSLLVVLLPEDALLPKTVYLFKKLLPPFDGKTVFFCPKCKNTLEDNNLAELVCACTNTPFSKKDLVKNGNCYIYLSIEQQLRRLLEEHSLGQLLKDKVFDRDFLSDIMDGTHYKTFGNGKLSSKYALSLIMNTDGAPVFKSSKTSMWPVQLFINELPASMRKKFMVLSSLWVGKVKPSLKTLLRSTVDELTALSNAGFQWTLERTRIITSTVDLIGCSVDSIARAPLQNFEQFNGLFGCSWCEHPGSQMPKEEGGHHVYEFRSNVRRRKHRRVLKHARMAESESYSVYGVKGRSVLSEIPFFDIVDCILFDSMHCVDLGVTRQLCSLWFDSSNHECPWYMGPELKHRLNIRLSAIRPPSNLTRPPRSTEERSFWKSSEWRNFLLYYGPIALFGLLPEPYYSHFLLLSEAIYLLNKTDVKFDDVCEARKKLESFVEKFQELYKIRNMSFNVHQLLHACDCVIFWGPLWCYSAYGFEDLNGKLLNMFNGTQAVAIQITKRFLLNQHLKCLTDYICHNIDCDENLDRFVNIQKKNFCVLSFLLRK